VWDRLRESARVEPAEDVEPGAVDETLAELDLGLTVREALESLGEPCSDLLDHFFCRDELPDARRGVRPSRRHDRKPDLALPGQAARAAGGKKRRPHV
jgi:hypothetical protein